MRVWRRAAWLVALTCVVCCTACNRFPGAKGSSSGAAASMHGALPSIVVEGRKAYDTYCAGCHGVNGDGNGPAAGFMHPRPRNFQNALFKFSSTRAGRLPTDDDLRRSIKEGLSGSSMPSWRFLPEPTVTSLIAYIKTFSPAWHERKPGAPIPVVGDPYYERDDKSQAVARGEAIYHGYATCWTCHPSYVPTDKINGFLVEFDNPTRDAFRDDLFHSEVKPNKEGELIYPPDFRRDLVRSGSTVDALYRSIAAGITGTAMPTWVDSIVYATPDGKEMTSQADLWALAYYTKSLIDDRPVLLASGDVDVRTRPVPVYLHGVPPQQEQAGEQPPAESFEEESDEAEFFEE